MEKELVLKFKEAQDNKERMTRIKAQAEKDYEIAKANLVDYMNSKGIKRTATYEGIGFVGLDEPRLRAYVEVANRERLMDWLRSIDRPDVIREDVHMGTLSVFVKEWMGLGKELPDYVTTTIQSTAKFHER